MLKSLTGPPEKQMKDELRLPKRKGQRTRGFTLVELLVVVLIIATLMAVALPLYLSAVADASKKTCRANMKDITSAAQAWKVKNIATDFTGVTLSTLTPDMGSVPICPDGGTYTLSITGTVDDADGVSRTIPTGGIGVSCSYGDHHGYIPGVTAR
jgi:type IV pilus assembly protein PilA